MSDVYDVGGSQCITDGSSINHCSQGHKERKRELHCEKRVGELEMRSRKV